MGDSTRHRVLLTVSGTIPDAIAAAVLAGERPQPDYLAMASAFGADLLDHPAAVRSGGRFGPLIRRVAGPDVALAWACFRLRRQYDVVFTDGEQVGIPFAALCWLTRRRPRHVMIGHLLSPRKKVLVHRVLHLQRRIDRVVVYASAQCAVAVDELGYPPDQVVLSPFMVDTSFWSTTPAPPDRRPRPMVCSVGLELRDYPTLIASVRNLDVDVVIAASSPWSKRRSTAAEVDLPTNVRVAAFTQFDLRQLYADAAFVVVPLEETDFQAGITTILEAMSMGKAVICSRTAGQVDTVVDHQTGIYVPPGDVAALREAIRDLATAPERARRMGDSGREWAHREADVHVYAKRLAALVQP